MYRIVPITFLSAILKNKIKLHGGGKSKRSFIHISDASSATYLIYKKGKKGETYHISTDKIISIKELVKKISKISNTHFKNLIKKTKDRMGKDHNYNLSSQKIRRDLNWKPNIDLEEGLKETFDWIKKNLNTLKKHKKKYVHKK